MAGHVQTAGYEMSKNKAYQQLKDDPCYTEHQMLKVLQVCNPSSKNDVTFHLGQWGIKKLSGD
jgi:hypothetical protein